MPREYDRNTDPSVIVPVDENGLRVAPNPQSKSDIKILPKAVQPFEFQPTIKPLSNEGAVTSSVDDFQPKKRDVSKRRTRSERERNIFTAILMLFVTMAVLVPYILSAVGIKINEPFKYTFNEYNVFSHLVETIRTSSSADAATLKNIWFGMIPELILIVGIIALAINILKSFIGIFGARRPVKYFLGATIYLIAVLSIFIMALVGIGTLGVAKIDFVNDFIKGYATSEYFTLIVFGVGNLLFAFIVKLINPDRSGY